MFKSSDNFNTDLEQESELNNDGPTADKNDKKDKVFIQDAANLDITSGIKYNDESEANYPNQGNLEEKRIMSIEEVQSLIDNKKSELDIKVYDSITRHQVEEKKIEELYNNETDEGQKAILLAKLEEEIKKNEKNLANLKE